MHVMFVVLVAIRHCASFHLSGGFKPRLGNRVLSSALLGEREKGNAYVPTLRSIYEGDQQLINEILNKEYTSTPKGFVMPTEPWLPYKPLEPTKASSEFQELKEALDSTLPAEVNDYDSVMESEPEDERVVTSLAEPTIRLRKGQVLTDFDHSEEDIDDDNIYEYAPTPKKVLEEQARAEGKYKVIPGEPSEWFFYCQGTALEELSDEELEAHGQELWQNQHSINFMTREISLGMPGLEQKYGMNLTSLKNEVMLAQKVQDRYWEVFEFIAQVRNLNKTNPEFIIDQERETDYIDIPHPKDCMIMARACIIDGNTTAVRHILDIFDYIRRHFNNTDSLGYMLQLIEPVVVPDVGMSEEQWYEYRKAHPLVEEEEKVEVEGGFVRVKKLKCYISDAPAREYPPQDPVKSALRNLENSLQMWVEGHNMYHLINGLAMKERWGYIVPHILESERNRKRICDKIQFALHEQWSGAISMSGNLARIRTKVAKSDLTPPNYKGYGSNIRFPVAEEDVVVDDTSEDGEREWSADTTVY